MCNCMEKHTCNNPILNPDATQFKLGDRVYSLVQGWGKVTHVYSKGIIDVRSEDHQSHWYSAEGKLGGAGLPILFHDKPTIVPPKKKVKKWLWAYGKKMTAHITPVHYTEKEFLETVRRNCDVKTQVMFLPWTEIEVDE